MSITGTLIIQMIVFLILVGFTMKYIWPPITAALDERAKTIADGLSAADKAKADLATANKRVEAQLSAARDDAAKRLADASSGRRVTDAAATSRAHRRSSPSSSGLRPVNIVHQTMKTSTAPATKASRISSHMGDSPSSGAGTAPA